MLPTALAAAGVKTQPEWKLDGVDLLPFLRGEAKGVPHDTLYWRFGPQMAIRHGDWKVVRYDSTADGEAGRQVTPLELYNLAEDIGESQDLAEAQPEKLKELRAEWDKWNAELVSPLWGAGRIGSRLRPSPRARQVEPGPAHETPRREKPLGITIPQASTVRLGPFSAVA